VRLREFEMSQTPSGKLLKTRQLQSSVSFVSLFSLPFSIGLYKYALFPQARRGNKLTKLTSTWKSIRFNGLGEWFMVWQTHNKLTKLTFSDGGDSDPINQGCHARFEPSARLPLLRQGL
jgi:hypothetical protein